MSAPDEANLERLLSALRELNARPLSPDHGARLDLPMLLGHGSFALDSDAGGIDVHGSPPGAPPYRELRRRALVVGVFGVEVAFADRDDLIAMKRAAGRPIDIGDIAVLVADDAPPGP